MLFHRPGGKRSSPDVVPECRVPRACAHHNGAAPVFVPAEFTSRLLHDNAYALRLVTRITLAIVV
jgi:hypothetical protein